MKKLLILAALALFSCLPAKAQQYQQSVTLTSAASATNYGSMFENSNVATHVLSWTANAGTGAVSSCTIQLQSAPDNATWSSLGAAQTCTSSGSVSVGGAFAYVRVTTTAATLTGNATVQINYSGYVAPGYFLTGATAGLATATTAGTCVQSTGNTVTGAAVGMLVSVTPATTPGVGSVWSGFVASANTVTVNECAVATSAGGTIVFNIRVYP